MSSPSEPSAGTARPDAALSDRHLLDELETLAVAWGSCRESADIQDTGVECARKFNAVLGRFAELRLLVADREAECERLRPFETRYKWLKRWLRSEINPRRLPEGWIVGPSSEFDKIVNLASGASAAVAPAAREPTTETSDGE